MVDRSRQSFAIIGAMKAGTTSLHRALAGHPEIGMPARKELDYFSAVREPSATEYFSHFRWCKGTVTGEASPSYTMYPTHGDVAARMAQVVPDAKLIYCIRDPVDRMRSHFKHEVLRSREERWGSDALHDIKYLIPSLYGLQLERFLVHFEPEQVAIVSLGDLWHQPEEALRALYRFLGVDPWWRDQRGIQLDYESSARPALTSEVERLRHTPVMRAVLGQLPSELKQRVGFHLPGADEATRRARALMASEEEWEPSGEVREWIEQDQAQFARLTADCERIGPLSGDEVDRDTLRRLDVRVAPRSGPDLEISHRLGRPATAPPTRPRQFPVPSGAARIGPLPARAPARVAEPLRVSVTLPLYNPSPRFLGQALESLRVQTVAPHEIIVRDDSKPGRRALVDRLGAGLPITYVANPSRLGMVENWNASVDDTTGSHVVVLHQDDLLERRALEMMASVFREHPGLAICAAGEVRIDVQGREWCQPTRPNHRERVFITRGVHHLSYEELTYLVLRNGQVFGEPSALMMSREHFDAIGGFDPDFRQSVDIDLALRMAASGGAADITERLVRRRVHPEQATQANIVAGHNLSDLRVLYDRHAAAQDIPEPALDRMRANLVVRAGFDGLRALRYGRWSVVREAVSQMAEYRAPAGALGERLVELSLWTNDDAR
jgi:hypothetical protein